MWPQEFCLRGVVILHAIDGTWIVPGLGWVCFLHNSSQDEYFCVISDSGNFSNIPVRMLYLNSGVAMKLSMVTVYT